MPRGERGIKNTFRQCEIKLMVVIIMYYWAFTKYRPCSKCFHQRPDLAIPGPPQGGYHYYPHLKRKPPIHREGKLPRPLVHARQCQPTRQLKYSNSGTEAHNHSFQLSPTLNQRTSTGPESAGGDLEEAPHICRRSTCLPQAWRQHQVRLSRDVPAQSCCLQMWTSPDGASYKRQTKVITFETDRRQSRGLLKKSKETCCENLIPTTWACCPRAETQIFFVFLYKGIILPCFSHGAAQWAQDPLHARQVFNHWATSPALMGTSWDP